MTIFALTGSNSLASTGSWSASKIIECDLNLFNKLKPNQIIYIHYNSCISGESIAAVKVGRRSYSKKYDIKKITLRPINENNPIKQCPYFLFNRNNKITASHGDFAINILRVRFQK